MKSKKVLREILADGGAVVLPTETVYGLFAKALDESAVNHVYELKNRPRDKAMNLNVAPAKILRQGKITKEDLLAALPELTIE